MDYTSVSQLGRRSVSLEVVLFGGHFALRMNADWWRLILTSFQYQQRFVLRSFICHLSKSNYTPHRECRTGPLLFFYCLVATQVWSADITGLPQPLAPTRPVLLSFAMFYSLFPLHQPFHLLLASRHSTVSALCPLLLSFTIPPLEM